MITWLFGARTQEQTLCPGRIRLVLNWPNLKSVGTDLSHRQRDTETPLCCSRRLHSQSGGKRGARKRDLTPWRQLTALYRDIGTNHIQLVSATTIEKLSWYSASLADLPIVADKRHWWALHRVISNLYTFPSCMSLWEPLFWNTKVMNTEFPLQSDPR